MTWQFKREESQFEQVPVGQYRIRIRSVEKKQSQSGRDMLAFQFDVSGVKAILYHYIVFMPDRPEITNRNLTQFFDSFLDIPEGNFNLQSWVGKMGACNVAVDKNDNTRTRLSSFISFDRAKGLPAWQEPQGEAPRMTEVQDQFNPFI